MVKVSDTKIGALRKMHAQYLLRRCVGGGTPAVMPPAALRLPVRLLDAEASGATQTLIVTWCDDVIVAAAGWRRRWVVRMVPIGGACLTMSTALRRAVG
jgi:hypothetical protein